MDRWKDLLKDEPPRVPDAPTLHHYTDAFGVHGIITSGGVWATAAQFSNDLSEINYAVSVASEIIDEVWKTKKNLSPWERWIVNRLRELVATPLHSFGQPFIVSFCENGDLLSQWRAYGRESGFSLAFGSLCRNQRLEGLACKGGFRTSVRKVIYEPDKQRERLRFILENLIKLVNGLSFTHDSREAAPASVALAFVMVLEFTDWACAVKHTAFSQEQEWRIITYPKSVTMTAKSPEDYEGVLVRPTSRLLLPYMTLEASTGTLLPIAEIRCGPSQFQEQSGRALDILLRKYGYEELRVTFSGVPLRV